MAEVLDCMHSRCIGVARFLILHCLLRQKLAHLLQLPGVSWPRECGDEAGVDQVIRRLIKAGVNETSQGLSISVNMWIVHHQQRLRCDRRRRPAPDALYRVRRVKRLQHRDPLVAFDREVDAASSAAFVERSGTRHYAVQLATDGKHRVANGLRIQTCEPAAPE